MTIVDMGDVPESSVSIPDLSLLRQQWPPAVLSHMVWLQQELEGMRAEAKQRFRQTRLSSCVYCGTWIKCNMYRHMAKLHLDLAQLWRCPVSWCTGWKGTYGSCSGGGGHMMFRGMLNSASLEQFLPPWTVRRQVWSDSLKPQHLGISTDILLFSDINLSLVHHYRIHKRGLPHVAFRRNHMLQLHVLLPLPVAQPVDGVLSPASTGPGSLRQASSTELVGESPRRTRRAKRRMRPVLVVGTYRLVTFRSSHFRILRMYRGWPRSRALFQSASGFRFCDTGGPWWGYATSGGRRTDILSRCSD